MAVRAARGRRVVRDRRPGAAARRRLRRDPRPRRLSVKRDGLLVVFADVEAAVEKVEGILRAVVVAAGESLRGSRLVAVCLPDPTAAAPLPDAVRRRCFDLLPRYAVPDEVVIVEALPHLPSGKVDRRAVREWIVAGREPRGKRCAL